MYFYDGVFFVDDTGVDAATKQALQSGGGMMLMASPGPPGVGGSTNSGGSATVCCNGPTNFSLTYGSSTSELWLGIAVTASNTLDLVIHTTNSSTVYDLFSTTNLTKTVPGLNQTNWTWLLRTAPGPTNFVWGGTNWCEAWFQLGTMLDSDGDGLTDAYENLVSHTRPDLWDTDGDGLSDGWEWLNGLNPLVDESAQSGSRLNYTYDAAGRLKQISGAKAKSIGVDAEGNILQLAP